MEQLMLFFDVYHVSIGFHGLGLKYFAETENGARQVLNKYLAEGGSADIEVCTYLSKEVSGYSPIEFEIPLCSNKVTSL